MIKVIPESEISADREMIKRNQGKREWRQGICMKKTKFICKGSVFG